MRRSRRTAASLNTAVTCRALLSRHGQNEAVIEYRRTVAGLTADQLAGPFFVGWADPPDPETHLRLLEGSDHVVLAVDEEDQTVVGFAAAISDGVLAAYISFLEVIEEHRGRGIGSDLIRHLLDDIGNLYMIDAVADPGLQPFYRHLGLQPVDGMVLRNHHRRSGP